MFLNIVTACSRPENLHRISQSINIPKENYRWIVVFDLDELPSKDLIPDNCEVYLHRDKESLVGNSQRNFANGLVIDGHVYSNDDDTILHPNLWENIKDVIEDFISFMQENPDGSIRLKGNVIAVNHIDTHSFIVSRQTIGETTWVPNVYAADGQFAAECYKKSLTKKYIPLVLSTYNSLR